MVGVIQNSLYIFPCLSQMAYIENEYQRLMRAYRPELSIEPKKEDITALFSDLEKRLPLPIDDTIRFHTPQDYKTAMYHLLKLVEVYGKCQ